MEIFDELTIGIEEEYMICDPRTGNLINKADQIMKSLDLDIKDRFSYELLLSEIESNTSICENVHEAINEIINHRKLLKKIGEKNNFKLGIWVNN